MLKHSRLPLTFGLLAVIGGCGGGGGSTDNTDNSSKSPYTGTCGRGTAVYALANGGSSSETSPSFKISGEQDRSAFCAQDSGTSIALVTPTIVSSAVTSSNSDSSLYGLSASVLAYGSSATSATGGSITISGGTITTTTAYANGAFATGMGSTLTLNKITASTSGGYAHALVASRSATATITGTSDSHTSLTSTAGEVVVLEGASQITMSNTDLLSTNANDNRGVYIYDSGTGSGASTLNITGGSYVWSSTNTSASAFYVKNQTTTIALSGLQITNPQTSALLRAVTGSAGSHVTLNATGQTLSGAIIADASSTIALSLSGASSLSGAVNSDNTANSITVSMDSGSTWTVGANSYVTVLNDTAGISGSSVTNITGNGHNVYYKSSSNPGLAGATYSLVNGGSLIPY